MKASEFIPKSDVRQLIKVTKSQIKKIDHPHARYNQLGRISCVVCGVQIKSELAWNAHVMSKSHKQNETRVPPAPLKRTIPPSSASCSTLELKVPRTTDTMASNPVEGSSQPVENANPPAIKNSIQVVVTGEKNPAEKTRDSVSSSKLPEGFFDDKYKDAKMRNVPFKDKLTEEVELFQKEMVSLEKQSERIIEKEMKEMVSGRELDEIDTQLEKWERIQQLQLEIEALESKRKDQTVQSQQAPSPSRLKKEPTTSSESEESEAEELYDFRVKNTV
ncbi:hypothetical protein T265_04950 [Opisthorchis viverrini]|uniref:Zinc finger protein 830 n=1 Tax=Opisthorchis viverrini TaxID=6198 RepID=A0A074ZQW9_OPIVI|nr:hypothetical protein T265_04950 [Opisthorchis viverrini]KER28197.1 hypothetical protein T265_04950 [Opisthorchis viverrini]